MTHHYDSDNILTHLDTHLPFMHTWMHRHHPDSAAETSSNGGSSSSSSAKWLELQEAYTTLSDISLRRNYDQQQQQQQHGGGHRGFRVYAHHLSFTDGTCKVVAGAGAWPDDDLAVCFYLITHKTNADVRRSNGNDA